MLSDSAAARRCLGLGSPPDDPRTSDGVARRSERRESAGTLEPIAGAHVAAGIRCRLPRVARRVMLRHLDTVIHRIDELYGTRLRGRRARGETERPEHDGTD